MNETSDLKVFITAREAVCDECGEAWERVAPVVERVLARWKE